MRTRLRARRGSLAMDRSKSLERRRQRWNHSKVRSTTQRRDMTTTPLVSLGFPMTSTVIEQFASLSALASLSPPQAPSANTICTVF